MRIMTAAVTAAILCGQAGSAQALSFKIGLLPDQLADQPGMDSWTGELMLPGPFLAPANGTVQLDFVFDGGFLRLSDFNGTPEIEQRRYRERLLDRLASQQTSKTALESKIMTLDEQIADKRATRTGVAAQLQQYQADLVEVQADLRVIEQSTETLETQLTTIEAALVAANSELEDAAEAVADFLGDLFSDAYEALVDARDQAIETVSNLLNRQSQVNSQLTQARSDAQVKQVEQTTLNVAKQILKGALDHLDGDIAQLETEKADTGSRLRVLVPMISVTTQELAQLPEDETAERLMLTVGGRNGEPVPLFGQLQFDIAAGNAAWSAPFFQGVFEGGLLQSVTYADITPSFVDLRGFRLVLDLFGEPGEPFVMNRLTFDLRADEIGIVSRAGATPLPEPATMAILGCGFLGLGWLRRRSRQDADASGVPWPTAGCSDCGYSDRGRRG